MTRHIRRGGKVWITIFPDRSLTKKPAETRMRSGKIVGAYDPNRTTEKQLREAIYA